MIRTLWHRLDMTARNLSPFAISILLVMMAMVPVRIPEISPVLPSLALIAVFYWSIYRPDLMPVWAVFLIGIFEDLLGGGPIGIGTISLLLVHGIVRSQPRFFASASFMVMWFLFALAAAGAIATVWLLTCLYYGVAVHPRPALFQFFLTVAIYPCLAWIFAQAQRAFLR